MRAYKGFVKILHRLMTFVFARKYLRAKLLACVLVLFSAGAIWTYKAPPAYCASAPCGCTDDDSCSSGDVGDAVSYINQRHQDIFNNTKQEFEDDLSAFEDWMIHDFLEDQIVPAVERMLNQMNAVTMQYTMAIGMFLDAENQMETQRVFDKLKYEAHRDYHPSDDFCWFGTNVRSLAASRGVSSFTSSVLSQVALARQLGVDNLAGARGAEDDLQARWKVFTRTYCNFRDNNRIRPGTSAAETSGTGLEMACDHDGSGTGTAVGGDDSRRLNRDINYTRLIDDPRTLEIDFTDTQLNSSGAFGAMASVNGDEQDVLEMSKNLYGHDVLSRLLDRKVLASSKVSQRLYSLLRSVAAKRSVAQYSFDSIVGLKTKGTTLFSSLPFSIPAGLPILPGGLTISGYTVYAPPAYMAAIMAEIMPVPATGPTANLGSEIYSLIGLQPSYYAQLEILAKRIYQNPDFYANLYESEANVQRKDAAMQAIELMVDREIYESQMRKEMMVSVLLSNKLHATYREVSGALGQGASSGN